MNKENKENKKIAVVKTGGKQYLVTEGQTLKVEKLPGEEGKSVSFDYVLLAATPKTTVIGTPRVKGAKVEAKIVRQGRAKKVVGVKMKAKKRYRRYFGHRQPFTEVEIKKIATR